MGDNVLDYRFDDGSEWTLYGTNISITGGELVATYSASDKGAKVIDASSIKAGGRYLVKLDLTSFTGSGNDWTLSFAVGGGVPLSPYASVSSSTTPLNAATINKWRAGVYVTATADGTPDNTYIEFSGVPAGDELIPDPECDDPAAWTLVAGSGFTVAGGQLRFENSQQTTIVTIAPVTSQYTLVPGRLYTYEVDVASLTGSPTEANMLFGGTYPVVHDIYNLDGAGVFTGSFVATSATYLKIRAGNVGWSGQWYINSITVKEAEGGCSGNITRFTIMAGGAVSLYETLSGYAGLAALIGNGDSPETFRIYPMVMPQDPTLPGLVYQNIIGTRVNTLSDAGGNGVERNLYQLTAWATTYAVANSVIEQARLALKSANIRYIPQSNADIYEPDTKLFGIQYDFAQWYRD